MKKSIPNPANFRPQTPSDLLGKASELATAVISAATHAKHQEHALFKVLFYGPPGTGKTTIANMLAQVFANERIDIESLNGRNLTIDTVRDWQKNNCYGSLFGGWKIKIVNEMDLVPIVAQDLMLTYLDELSPRTAVIGTSNEDVATLSQRFKSRFQCIRVPAPSQNEIAAWLKQKFSVARQGADWIATTCCGNVRQALLDAASLAMTGVLPEEIKARPALCASRSEAAKRAWETMRAGKAVAA